MPTQATPESDQAKITTNRLTMVAGPEKNSAESLADWVDMRLYPKESE